MTPQEKWDRIKNPKTLEDFCLSISESELLEFEEGRELVELMRKKTDDGMDLAANMIAGNTNQTIDRIFYGVFVVSYDESRKNGEHDGKRN